MMRINIKTHSAHYHFYALIALLVIPLSGLTIDIYVPSLPAISQYFQVPPVLAQLSITLYMIGIGVMQLFAGFISDSFGRRKPFLIAMFIYIIATCCITLANNIYQLLFFRLLQGISIAMCIVPMRSVFPDLFTGEKLYKMMAYMTMAWALGPIVAPALGGYLQYYFNWKANFYFLVIYSLITFLLVLFYLPETSFFKHALHARTIIKRYLTILSHRDYICGLAINGLLYSMIIIFSIVGPFLIQNVLHYSAIIFGRVALLIGLAWFLGALNNRFLINIKLSTKSFFCFLFILLSAVTMFISAAFAPSSIYHVVIPMFIIAWLAGLVFPSNFAAALSLFKETTGSANALFGSFVFLISAVASVLGTLLKSGNAVPMSLAFILIAGLMLIIHAIKVR